MPLTIALIVICVIVALFSRVGANTESLLPLFISAYGNAGLPEIRAGELWRLLTPIFIHFGFIHIVFNMLWLYDLGRVLEVSQKSPQLGLLIVIIGVLSNLAQYAWGGPGFGGMSGVVYGLLGYVWMQARYNPRCGFIVNQQIMLMMMAWFVICWLGIVGNVANMAHTAGLLSGGALGWIFSLPRRS
jgi:membrane associated rhomboid family serine protease